MQKAKLLGDLYARYAETLSLLPVKFVNCTDGSDGHDLAILGYMVQSAAFGVPQNIKKALQLYKHAADEYNSSIAHQLLGKAYSNGIGGKFSIVLAVRSFEKAINLGLHDACFDLGSLYENCTIMENFEQRYASAYERGYKLGSVRCQVVYAICLIYGFGVAMNEELGWSLWHSAKLKKNALASVTQAYYVSPGTSFNGIPIDTELAMELCRQAIEQEHCSGYANLSTLVTDNHLAVQLSERGAQFGMYSCQYQLACYHKSKSNTKEADHYLRISAEQRFSPAMVDLHSQQIEEVRVYVNNRSFEQVWPTICKLYEQGCSTKFFLFMMAFVANQLSLLRYDRTMELLEWSACMGSTEALRNFKRVRASDCNNPI